jgi:hypothetical protein
VSEGGARAVLGKEEEKRGAKKGRRRRWCLLLYRCGGKAAEGGEGEPCGGKEDGVLARRSGGTVGRQRPEADRRCCSVHGRC